MKQLNILTLVLLIACSNNEIQNNANPVSDSLEKTDSIIIKPVEIEESIVTKEFNDLVNFLDSSGFIYDSARFAKTYKEVNQTRPIRYGHYLFYVLKLEETAPILELTFHGFGNDELYKKDTAKLREWNSWKERWQIKQELLEKAEKIIAYFYIEKTFFKDTPSIAYYDGIIEEWTFPDTASARKAAFDLSRKETMVYINRGAYVCYLRNHMYVFHTRSAGFYTPLKYFVEYFCTKYNGVMPYKSQQRKAY